MSLHGKHPFQCGRRNAQPPGNRNIIFYILVHSVPEEHKAGIDMRRDMLRRSHTLIVCGSVVDEDVKNDIAVAGRLGIAATTLEGVLAVKGHGTPGYAGH